MDSVATDNDLKELYARFIDDASANDLAWFRDPSKNEARKTILELPLEQRPLMIRLLLAEFKKILEPVSAETTVSFGNFTAVFIKNYALISAITSALGKLLRGKLNLTNTDLELLLECAALQLSSFESLSLAIVLRTTELYVETHLLSTSMRTSLQKLLSNMEQHLARPRATDSQRSRENRQRITALLFPESAKDRGPLPLATAEPWAAAAQRDIDSLSTDNQKKCRLLLLHLQSADGAKPTKKWLQATTSLVDSIGRERFEKFLLAWLPLAPKTRDDLPVLNHHAPDPNLLFSPASQSTLKGLAWAASLLDDPAVSAALGDLGETSWKKIPNHGPRSKLVGNAVLWSLSAIGSPHAVAQLTRINSKLKHASARALADKAMNRVADATGQTRDDLEELAVPTFDLDPAGKHAQILGNFTAALSLTPSLDVDLTFTDAQGKLRKSIPTELKANHIADLKSLQRRRKEMETVLAAQRFRIESLLRLPDRSWSFENWKSRYADHPLLSHLARRLIWQFSNGTETFTALPHNGTLLQSDGSPLITNHQLPITKLWHPCTDSIDSVRAWRNFLTQHQITQPFKQAHREIYLLTDAERQTATYSNRFAAHIIRQHQFNALCAARGWKYKLQGAWDGHNVPALEIPSLNLRVEFWVEQLETPDAPVSASYVSMLLSTDQVRFHDRTTGPLPLQQLAPQLFSEIMRDIDLFVGVCSVANDPTWNDGGPDGRYRQYWQTVSFGDLNASAQTRKEILASLLPRLAIANVATLSDKFLLIQGSLRAYKIHLGSANILMQPNDQYLCIVPDRSSRSDSTAKLHLPFEGDTTLAVILSKAFLLANDRKITDPSILRQIRP